MKFERNSSYSWWWDSHNIPRQPGWLQSALGEIDERTRAMLKLIEEDADSFAQRAEMYYKKRPELISLVEEFYRAYRALAERYDHLNGEMRQGIPKVLQVQYGISYETPFEFPFGNHNLPCKHEFHKLLGRQGSCGSDSEASEVYDPESEADRTLNVKSSRLDSEDLSALSSSESEVENPPQEVVENRRGGSGRKMEATISNLREEKPRLLKQSSAESLQSEHLTDEINNLKRERNSMKEEMSLIDQEKGVLEKELNRFKTENKILRKQNEDIMQRMQTLGKSVDNLQAENSRLSKQNKIISTVLGFVGGQAASLARSNARLRNEICQGNQQYKAILQMLNNEKTKTENMFEAEVKKVSELSLTIGELQGEVHRLWEENQQQKVALTGQNGEKKEAIRRLCVIDDPEPEGDRKNNINTSDQDSDDLGAVSSYESEVDDPPQEVAENKRVDGRMREMQATISSLQEDKARLLKRLSAKRLGSKHLKDKINNMNKQRNFMKEEMSLVVQANGVLKKELQEFKTEHDNILRNQNGDAMQRKQALGKDAMSTIFGFVGGEAASLEKSNARRMNEMCKCNHQSEAILQISKDEKMNFENMFEAELRRESELKHILTNAELQSEVCRLREENRQQKIALVDQNEEKREAIRQLCFAMDVLRDNNQKLQEAVRSSRGGGGGGSKLFAPFQFSGWKKFLYAALDGTFPRS